MSPRNLFNRFRDWASGGNSPPTTDDAGVALDRLKKEAEDKSRHLIFDRPQRARDEEAWLTEQRNETGSPYFKRQSEERKKLAKANAARKALDSFEGARPRTALRALSFAGGDPLFQKLTKQLDDALLAKHRGLTDKFLEIAERKVGVVDDYGDENWEALEKEVDRCVLKIAKIEGDERVRDVEGEWMFEMYELPQVDSTGVHYGWLKYERLQRNLKEAFHVYHAKCKAKGCRLLVRNRVSYFSNPMIPAKFRALWLRRDMGASEPILDRNPDRWMSDFVSSRVEDKP